MNDIIKENKFDYIIPVLNVKNIAESLKYYQHVLGFKKDWDWGEPVSFASVSRDGVSIFLCQDAQGQAGMWMSIFINNVDDLYEEYKASGAKVLQPPTNFPWGMREMNVEDLDGHRFRMGSDTTEPSAGIPLHES